MIKLPLKQKSKGLPESYRRTTYPWASCAPFVENRRGILIHRPRSVATHTILKPPHFAVAYWCGATANNSVGVENLTFLEAPPSNAILCERCEQNAVAAGLPSAEELAGRHVHIGKLKAILTCGCAQEQGGSDDRSC